MSYYYLEEVVEFKPKLLSSIYYEALVHGNLSKEDAENTLHLLNKVLKSKPLNRNEFPIKQVVELDPSRHTSTKEKPSILMIKIRLSKYSIRLVLTTFI